MKSTLLLVVLALGAGFFWVRHSGVQGADVQPSAAKVPWMTDASAAFARAQSENKPVLINFTGSDWCGWCIRLDQEVFATKAFHTYAEEKLVLLKIDFPRKNSQSATEKAQNQNLQSKYEVQGFPTIVVADAQGIEKGRLGYQPGGPQSWLKSLDQVR